MNKTILGVLAGAVALTSLPAVAQNFPTRPVTIVNSFGVGGPIDVYSRPLAQKLSEWWGQSVVVEAKPGASGIVAAQFVKNAPQDGHTLLAIANTHTTNETLNPNRNYVLLKDFKPITQMFASEHGMFVSNKLGVNTVQELIALAKKEPGKLTFASSGPGSTYHLATELFMQKTGIKMLHVPYKASTQARTDVISGQVDMFFDLTGSLVEQAKAGQVKLLATTGPARSPIAPDVPTAQEAGVPGYEVEAWGILMAPSGTPDDVVQKIYNDVHRFMVSPEGLDVAKKQGMRVVGDPPDKTRAFIESEIKKWGDVVRAADIKIQ
ncbi:MAG: tripartite tricarboxylate transporter substrate binding protein [Pseudolabrys sp.]|nr:tripartite tricarboxylate transporter substrate binding protein [Pseudolabrys sp.]